MEYTYILWHGEGEVERPGDNIYGADNNAKELKRWPEAEKEAAFAELSKYRCRYWDVKAWPRGTVKDADEYALELCETDEEDGEYLCGGFFYLAEEDEGHPFDGRRPEAENE